MHDLRRISCMSFSVKYTISVTARDAITVVFNYYYKNWRDGVPVYRVYVCAHVRPSTAVGAVVTALAARYKPIEYGDGGPRVSAGRAPAVRYSNTLRRPPPVAGGSAATRRPTTQAGGGGS